MTHDERDDELADEAFEDMGFETRAEKLAYLAGLAEGVQHEEDPATASLLAGLVEVLADVSDELGALRREQRVLAEDMDELADELGVQPSDVVVECPSCGREVAFASGLLNEEDLELTCPNCGEVVYTPGEDELVDEPDAGEHPEPGVVQGHAPHGHERGPGHGHGFGHDHAGRDPEIHGADHAWRREAEDGAGASQGVPGDDQGHWQGQTGGEEQR